jgi:glutathione peroxidase
MKTFMFISFILITIMMSAQTRFYDFKVETITGEEITLEHFKGKKIMIVNVASKCGLTPQYKDLQELYETFSKHNFVILGFPANNFLSQEPGTNEEIIQFCESNYGVTFPMMSKISVKGKDIHPLYKWLTTKELNGVWDGDISWNFQKFLIDENGNFVRSIGPRTSPLEDEITGWIKGD